MFPAFPQNNIGNTTIRDRENGFQFPESHSLRMKFSNVPNFIFCQFSILFHWVKPSLFDGILRIVLQGSEKKMHWIYAKGNIATMENTYLFRDWPIMQYPRRSVGAGCMGINTGCSIAHTIFGSDPHPASFRLSNKPPKSILNWNALSSAWVSLWCGKLVFRHSGLLSRLLCLEPKKQGLVF
ncbi:MAG: hypothetical protein AAB875_01135 [Patescibacteria group bacterium]